GLWLLYSSVLLIPQYFSLLFSSPPFEDAVFYIGLLSLGSFVFIVFLILRFLVLKPNIIINRLKLDEGFEEEKFELNISSSSVISIAVIVIGGIMIADSLPDLMRQIYNYFQMQSTGGFPAEHNPAGWIIFHFIKILIGYFLITNHAVIANYVQSKKTKTDHADVDAE
ncbi:MAG: hypothetical protein ACXWW0_02420, partial [Bacteroidia bacterium]